MCNFLKSLNLTSNQMYVENPFSTCMAILVCICGSPEAENTSEKEKTGTETPVDGRDLLKEYETYLNTITHS